MYSPAGTLLKVNLPEVSVTAEMVSFEVVPTSRTCALRDWPTGVRTRQGTGHNRSGRLLRSDWVVRKA